MKSRTYPLSKRPAIAIPRRGSIRMIALILGLIVVLGPASPAISLVKSAGVVVSGEATTAELETSDGRTRTYRIYIPLLYDESMPLPLVLVFHGGFGSGEQVSRQTGFDALAEREGFIAVYPDGATSDQREVVPTWNAGECCGYAMMARVDDVAFVSELLDSLESQFAIDPARVFATGMSNGGMLSYRLACELADRLAAVAPVAGSIEPGNCTPARPIPMLIFHGTADENVPYNGGPVLRTGNIVPAALDLVARWASMNGCDPDPVISVEEGFTQTRYSDCANDVSVTLYSIEGLGHAWPGSEESALNSGASSPVKASEVIWSFFESQE